MIKLTQNIISILVLVLLSNYSFGKNTSKSNRVIDGDTIVLNSKKIIGTNKVMCQKKTTDRYRRSISICFVNGKNINSLMVKSGWALAYRKYSNDYIKEEEEAKKKKIGLWAGEFVPPWKWRRLKR